MVDSIIATSGIATKRYPMKSFFPHKEFYPFQEQIIEILANGYEDHEYFILEAPPGIGKSAIADTFISYHPHGEVLTKQIRLQNQYIGGYGFKKVEGRSHSKCSIDNVTCDHGRCLTESEDNDVCKTCTTRQSCDKSDRKRKECEDKRTLNNTSSKRFRCDNKPYHPKDDAKDYPSEDLFAGESYGRGRLYWRKLEDNCEYWVQKIDAMNFGKVAHNYMYYLLESNFAGDFGSPEALVCDEAHAIEHIIMDFISVTISQRELTNIKAPIFNFQDADSSYKMLVALYEQFIPKRLNETNIALNEINNIDANEEDGTAKSRKKEGSEQRLKVEKSRLEQLREKIGYFLSKFHNNKTAWIFLPHVNEKREFVKMEFRPLYANDFVEDKLFQKSKKKLLMSATILDFDTFKRTLGITDKKCLTIQVPSPFPVENRLIYKANIAKLDAKSISPKNPNNVLKQLMSFIDQTVEHSKFRNEKGIIHTTTYKMAEYIEKHSVYSDRMLFHSDSKGANEVLEQHKNTNAPSVIVTPSMTDGVSLDDDLARFQIPLRVPYMNVGDPVIKERARVDRPWYFWQTALPLFQSFGRIVRNMTDYGITIIPDDRIDYFLGNQFGYDKVPGWISDSLRTTRDLERDIGLRYQIGY